MKFLFSVVLGVASLTGTMLLGNPTEQPVEKKCRCESCKCKPKNHCGCLTDPESHHGENKGEKHEENKCKH